MVSTRWKKRFIALALFACTALVCLYKIHSGSDQLPVQEIKSLPAFSSSESDAGKESVKEQTVEQEPEGDEDDEDVMLFLTDRQPIRQIGNEDTEPYGKIHRGLEDNEEVKETLRWLDDAGMSPPPAQPSSIDKVTTQNEPEVTVTDATKSKVMGGAEPVNHTETQSEEPARKSEHQGSEVINTEAVEAPRLTMEGIFNVSSNSTQQDTVGPAQTTGQAVHSLTYGVTSEKPPTSWTSSGRPFDFPVNPKQNLSKKTYPLSSLAQSTLLQPTKRIHFQQGGSLLVNTTNTTNTYKTHALREPLTIDKVGSQDAHYPPSSPQQNVSQPANTSVTSTQPITAGTRNSKEMHFHDLVDSGSLDSTDPVASSEQSQTPQSSMLNQSTSTNPTHLPTNQHPNVSTSQRTLSDQRTSIPAHFTRSSSSQNTTPMYTPSPNPFVCKLPLLDPWDPSIRHLLVDVGEEPGCRDRYPLPVFDVVANRLVLNSHMNASAINFDKVKVETIHRDDHNDWDVHFVDRGNPFNATVHELQVSRVIDESDFFKLTYTLKTGREDSHYFARVVPQRGVIEKSNEIRQDLKKQLRQGLGLNVLLLGFDSVSAASFLRKMPKTTRFLKESLETYIIAGQTVIGDATTPALTAILTGLYETEPPEGRRGFDNSGSLDKWPWLMRLFEEHGYVTMMTEDDPSVGAFNLRLNGFTEPPSHHYARPFWLSLEERKERDEPGVCSKSTFMVNYTLDYTISYFDSYPNTPKFGFTFMSYLSHAHPNHLSYADNDVLRILRTFVERNYHNNTLIVVFGDHGSRNDDVRNTLQGKLEERLPWLSLSVPTWLTRKYPNVKSALEHNQHIISSPFDLHATLHHVLTYPDEPQGEKTQSLFKRLNYTRMCSEAGISEHWCTCLEFTVVNVSHPDVVGGAVMAVKYINDVILNRTELLRKSCATVRLKKILTASQYQPNDKVQRFSGTNQDSDRAANFGSPTTDNPHYRINVMTSPGDALFEVTVTVLENRKVVVNPSISRTNVYGTQSSCISREVPYARKFCYCKQ